MNFTIYIFVTISYYVNVSNIKDLVINFTAKETRQKLEITQMSISTRMSQQIVVYPYNEILFRNKNK